MKIAALATGNSLEVTWQDGSTTVFPFLWLRDNAQDPDSYDARSNQREVFTAQLPQDIKPVSISLTEAGAAIQIQWPDQSAPVTYAAAFLLRAAGRQENEYALADRELWQGDLSPPQFSLLQLQEEAPKPGTSLVNALAHQGFALLENCDGEESAVQQIADLLGYVRETIFGGIWSFEADETMADSAYTPRMLRPHTDATYSHDAPGVQILLCTANESEGGESIMVDGFRVARDIARARPEIFQTLCNVPIEGEYRGDGVVLRAERPVFRCNRSGQLVQVSFNNYDRSRKLFSAEASQRLYAAIAVVETYFNDPVYQWRHRLAAGQALVFDNWRVLHGRTAYRGMRKMSGAYTNREDLESRYRSLASA